MNRLRPHPLVSARWALLLIAVTFWPRSASAICFDPAQCIPPVIISGEPVAPPPLTVDKALLPGTGLCGAFKQAGNTTVFGAGRTANFPSDAIDFPNTINDFMDGNRASGGGGDGPRVDQTLVTPFDLTNNVMISSQNANGDYIMTPDCSTAAGCAFPGSSTGDVSAYFGTRYRGFINIKDEWAQQPIHFGFNTSAAVAMLIFAKPKPPDTSTTMLQSLILSRPPTLGLARFRVTNGVMFPKGGLYPVEIIHAAYGGPAFLEFGVLFRSNQLYTDRDEAETNTNQVKLSDPSAYFDLTFTLPVNFFQTTSGAPPYPTAAECRQCPRAFANQQGQSSSNTKCEPGYFCNEAAVCSPCVGNQFCGRTCQPCRDPTPFCRPTPGSTVDATCVQCLTNQDCKLGQQCIGNVCTTPNLCCPNMRLAVPDANQPSVMICSPCATNADCGEGLLCDVKNLRCIDKIPEHNSDEDCGKDAINCKMMNSNPARPHCLNGQVCVQCRNDFECDSGKYCLSGDCVDCKVDRHCGPTCQNCGRSLSLGPTGTSAVAQTTDKPFCLTPDNTVGSAVCVRCTKDADCGSGGQCDPGTHDCINKCPETCAPGEFCDGSRCVKCYNSAQCPCGACDIGTGTCSDICETNADCMGNQCCTRAPDGFRRCVPGRCVGTAGGALCGCTVAPFAAATVDNNTLDAQGMAVGHHRGVVLASLAMMLCALALRRRFFGSRPWRSQ